MSIRPHTSAPVIIAGIVAVLLASGCSSTRSVGVSPSGFLGDLSSLQVVDAETGGEVLVSEPGVLGRYDRFLLDPVVIVFADDTPARAIDPEDLARLTASLRATVADALRDGNYDVVESPGPRVLRIRAALTRVDPSRPAVNVAGKAAGAAAGVGGFVVPGIDLGGASIEAEMIDSDTGVRVAAYLDARRGRRFGGTVDAARKWGHAEEAFGIWASELRGRLDRLRRER